MHQAHPSTPEAAPPQLDPPSASPPPTPASLLDLPELIIDHIAISADSTIRLACKRLRNSRPLCELRPIKPATLPLGAFLAHLTRPTLMRPLVHLDIDAMLQSHDDIVDLADHDMIDMAATEYVVRHVAAHCMRLEELYIGWGSGPILALLADPDAATPSTLRSLFMLAFDPAAEFPRDLAPLARLTSLQSLVLDLLPCIRMYEGASPAERERDLAPLLCLTQLTHLALHCRSEHDWGPLLDALPQLLATHIPHLARLSMPFHITWEGQAAAQLRALTALTHLNLVDVRGWDEGEHALCQTLASLPRLSAVDLVLGPGALRTLGQLFHPADGAVPQPPGWHLRALGVEIVRIVHDGTDLLNVTSALCGSASALTHLHIGRRGGRGSLYASSTQCLQQLATALPSLQSLSLVQTQLHGICLSPLAALASSLTGLTILHCGEYNPAALAQLTRLKRLWINGAPAVRQRWQPVLSQLPGMAVVTV